MSYILRVTCYACVCGAATVLLSILLVALVLPLMMGN